MTARGPNTSFSDTRNDPLRKSAIHRQTKIAQKIVEITYVVKLNVLL